MFGFVGALLFASSAWLGYVLSDALVSRKGVPGPGHSDVHPAILVAVAAVVGTAIGVRSGDPLHLVALSFAVISLCALIRCDVRQNWTPPWLSLVPLGCIVVIAIVQRAYWIPIATLVVALPFASVAAMTKGTGMSWSDVRVAALGTALVGFFPAIITFAAAGLVAAFVQWGLRRTSSIPMAPYLIGATAVAVLTFGG